jgi:hypothetical protein
MRGRMFCWRIFRLRIGEPEYRNALCAQIGEMVAKASLEELEALTVEFESGTVIALSLREEDLMGRRLGVIRRMVAGWMRRRRRVHAKSSGMSIRKASMRSGRSFRLRGMTDLRKAKAMADGR